MKNSPVRVLLIGAAGRMGKTVLDLAQSDPRNRDRRAMRSGRFNRTGDEKL